MSDLLVTAEWLRAALARDDVKVVDASWYLPAQNRNAKAEYAAGHIPGAVHFDIDAIADQNTDLPHMLPDASAFAKAVGALGLSDTDTIIVYDGLGLFSAPRVWWAPDCRPWLAGRSQSRRNSMPVWPRMPPSTMPLFWLSCTITPPRSSMRARRHAFPARRPNRAPACNPAISPARETYHSTACWVKMANWPMRRQSARFLPKPASISTSRW
jgi:rhodanese-related sulfurtransferase